MEYFIHHDRVYRLIEVRPNGTHLCNPVLFKMDREWHETCHNEVKPLSADTDVEPCSISPIPRTLYIATGEATAIFTNLGMAKDWCNPGDGEWTETAPGVWEHGSSIITKTSCLK